MIPDGEKVIDDLITKSCNEYSIFECNNEFKSIIVELIKISSKNNIRSAKKIINCVLFSLRLHNDNDEFRQYLYLLVPVVCMKLIYPKFYSYIRDALKCENKNEILDNIFYDELECKNIGTTIKDNGLDDDNSLKVFVEKLLLILHNKDAYVYFCKFISKDNNLFIADSIPTNHDDVFDAFIKNCKNNCDQLIEDVNRGINEKDGFRFDLSAYNLRKHCVNITWHDEKVNDDTNFYVALSLKYCNNENKFIPSIQISKNRTKKEIAEDSTKSKKLYDIFENVNLSNKNYVYEKINLMSTISFRFNDFYSFARYDEWNSFRKYLSEELIKLINILK